MANINKIGRKIDPPIKPATDKIKYFSIFLAIFIGA
jgi:hypothetical protein